MAAHQLMVRLKRPIVGWRHSVVQSLGSTIAVAPFVVAGFANFSAAGTALTLFYIWVIAIVITAVAELAARTAAKDALNADVRPALVDRLPVGLTGRGALFGPVRRSFCSASYERRRAFDHHAARRCGRVSATARGT